MCDAFVYEWYATPIGGRMAWTCKNRYDKAFYANADTTMKKEAIEKATSDFDPLFSNEYDIDWEDDEDLLKKLYGLK